MAKKNSAQRAEERSRRQEKADMRAAERRREKKLNPRVVELVAAMRSGAAAPAAAAAAPTPKLPVLGGVSGPWSPAAVARGVLPGSFGDVMARGGGYARAMGLVGGPAPAVAAAGPGASIVDQYIASLPAIDRAAYVAPFDQAESAARAAHGAAVPDIGKTYDALEGQLVAGNADAQAQMGRNRADLVAQLAATQAELQGFAAQGAASPHVTDPTLNAGFQSEMATRMGAATQSADQRVALADRFAQIQQQSADARGQDAGLAESAALSNASTNLQQILGAIGVKRAGAEAQFNNDSAQRAADVFKIRSDAEAQAADNATKEAKAAETAAAAEEKARKAATSTPAKLWKSGGENEMRTKYPRAFNAFTEIVNSKYVKGSGAAGLQSALNAIDALADDLKADGLNVQEIKRWATLKYDDWTEVDTRG